MNGEQAQLIALVAYGNYFLNQKMDAKKDLTNHSTFHYVNSVFFARYKSKNDTQGVTVANNLTEWFAFLHSNHVKRLWNVGFEWDRLDMAEHIAVSFSGGVPIAIQADMPDGFELWYPLWKTGGSPQKPWFIEYRGLKFQNSHVFPPRDMIFVKEKLREAISPAEQFARHCEVDIHLWADCFLKSLDKLDSPNPEIPYHPDLLPPDGYSLEARQVIAAASQAYVFGGMGSWNDLGFEKPEIQKEYITITQELYSTLKIALIMASNSFSI